MTIVLLVCRYIITFLKEMISFVAIIINLGWKLTNKTPN